MPLSMFEAWRICKPLSLVLMASWRLPAADCATVKVSSRSSMLQEAKHSSFSIRGARAHIMVAN